MSGTAREKVGLPRRVFPGDLQVCIGAVVFVAQATDAVRRQPRTLQCFLTRTDSSNGMHNPLVVNPSERSGDNPGCNRTQTRNVRCSSICMALKMLIDVYTNTTESLSKARCCFADGLDCKNQIKANNRKNMKSEPKPTNIKTNRMQT